MGLQRKVEKQFLFSLQWFIFLIFLLWPIHEKIIVSSSSFTTKSLQCIIKLIKSGIISLKDLNILQQLVLKKLLHHRCSNWSLRKIKRWLKKVKNCPNIRVSLFQKGANFDSSGSSITSKTSIPHCKHQRMKPL